ncbi:MAG: hypothetical protein JEZ08_02905 [Clostridiales bacterium]|nr:hypothetical protein [Clostridiales bacterium]
MRNIITKSIYIVIIVFLGICMLSCEEQFGVSPVTKVKETLVWSTHSRPRFFYPSMTLSDIEKQVVNQLYEGLTRVEDDQVKLGMAEKITVSDDYLIYEIKLKNAQWSDGKIIKTSDFLYSWERSENYREDVNLLYFDTFIDYVEVIDEKEFKIHLKYPNDELLKRLSTVEFMPLRADVIDLDLPIPIFLSDVTNGPYTFENYKFIGGITLVKNIHYYDFYKVKIDEINVIFRNDDQRVYQEFQEGLIDVVQDVDYTQLDKLLQNDSEFWILDKPGVYGFTINSNNEKLRDIKLRQLMNLAIDRSAINPFDGLIEDSVAYSVFGDKTLEELRKVSSSDFEYMGDLYSLNPSKPYADVDKVKQLLKDLDPSVLEGLDNIKITTTKNMNDILIARMLRDCWEEYLNISVQIEPKDRYDYAFMLNSKSYDIILNNHYYVDFSPRHMLKYFLSDTILNKTVLDSYKFDNIMMKTLIYDDSTLHKLYETAIRDINNYALMIPLFNTREPVLVDDALKGWTRSYESLFNFGRAYKKVSEEDEED